MRARRGGGATAVSTVTRLIVFSLAALAAAVAFGTTALSQTPPQVRVESAVVPNATAAASAASENTISRVTVETAVAPPPRRARIPHPLSHLDRSASRRTAPQPKPPPRVSVCRTETPHLPFLVETLPDLVAERSLGGRQGFEHRSWDSRVGQAGVGGPLLPVGGAS